MGTIEKLKDAFAAGLGIDVSKINDSLKYQGIAEWDSISHMVLVSEIEEAFDVSLETDEVIGMSSFKKAREIIAKKGITD